MLYINLFTIWTFIHPCTKKINNTSRGVKIDGCEDEIELDEIESDEMSRAEQSALDQYCI